MPEKRSNKPKPNSRQKFHLLISLGQSVIFSLSVLFWSLVNIGQKTFQIALSLSQIILGFLDTSSWLAEKYYRWLARLLQGTFKLLDFSLSHKTRQVQKFFLHLRALFKKRSKSARRAIKIEIPQINYRLALGLFLVLFFLSIIVVTRNLLSELPNPELLAERNIPVTTKIYDRNNILLYQIYSQQNRSLVKLNDIPPSVINATIAFEDKNFYSHNGLDFRGIARAVFADASGKPTQGGSTLTQQLVKSALLTPERTLERKIKEVVLSFWAERVYSKKQILEMYLNQIPYGGAAYGIEAAAETYFGKKVSDLTLAESAVLAGLPSAPSIYSPFGSHPEKTKEKQVQVLDAMVDEGYITNFQAESAKKEELHFKNPATEIKAPHFVMYVKDYLISKYGLQTVLEGGLNVKTTLDYPLYEKTLSLVHEGVEKQKYLNVGNGAALIVNPKTGEILTMVGSIDYFDIDHEGNVNVTLAERSPGSSIKPLTYATALDQRLLTPSTIIEDAPVVYRLVGSPPYIPNNYDNRFHGRVSVRTALGSSLNIPAVKVLNKISVGQLIEKGNQAGIASWQDPNRYGLSLTLGGGEVTMVEMTQLYSIFANGGQKIDLRPIISVTDSENNVLENDSSLSYSGSQVFSKETSFIISDILADNAARTPTFGPVSALVIPGKTVSVKTGTTQEKRDNWAIGYTPSLVAAVWVGNNDNSPMSPYLESGNTGAAAIWNPIMTSLLKGKPNETFLKPDGVVVINCPGTKPEYYLKGTEPSRACNFPPLEKDARKEKSP